MENDFINKITWKLWETDVEYMGVWLEDPKHISNKVVLSQAKNFF